MIPAWSFTETHVELQTVDVLPGTLPRHYLADDVVRIAVERSAAAQLHVVELIVGHEGIGHRRLQPAREGCLRHRPEVCEDA